MERFNKALLAPIVIMISFYLKLAIPSLQIPDATVDITVEGVWAVASLVSGIVAALMKPKKEEPPK